MSEFKMQVETPPAPRTGVRVKERQRAIDFARKAKGEWCAVAERDNYATANSLAGQWRIRSRAEGFEFCARTVENGQGKVFRVYCRFIGDKPGA